MNFFLYYDYLHFFNMQFISLSLIIIFLLCRSIFDSIFKDEKMLDPEF